MVVPADGAQPQADPATASPANAQTSQDKEVIPKAQADELVRNARSDALAEVGRLRKASEEAVKTAQAAQQRLSVMEREREEAELNAAKDEPDKLAYVRTRQQLRQRETALAEAEAKLNDATAKLAEFSNKDAETTKKTIAEQVAGRLNVNSATLAKLAKYTDGSVEAIEELAKDLPKVTPQQPANTGSRPAFRPDSNSTHGGAPAGKYEIMQKYTSGTINAIQYEKEMAAIGERP